VKIKWSEFRNNEDYKVLIVNIIINNKKDMEKRLNKPTMVDALQLEKMRQCSCDRDVVVYFCK
jgi:hypothetical protein